MLRRLLFLLLCLYGVIGQGHAQEKPTQTLRGRIQSKESQQPLSGVIVLLERVPAEGEKPRQVAYAQTDNEGTFLLTWQETRGGEALQLRLRRMGYESLVLPLRPPYEPLTLQLAPKAIELRPVRVNAPAIRSKGDTTTFSARQLKTIATSTLEDLIKRVPSLNVDGHGVITFQGKPISGVYIEGMNMLGGRYAVATRNIKADDVASIDLIEHFQKVKFLRDKQQGTETILNVHLKNKNMLRPVGELQAEGGVEEGTPREPLYGGKALALLVNSRLQFLSLLGAHQTPEAIAAEGLYPPEEGMLGLRSLVGTGGLSTSMGRADLGHGALGATINGMHRLEEEEVTLRYNFAYSAKRAATREYNAVRLHLGNQTEQYEELRPEHRVTHLGQAVIDYTANRQKSYLSSVLTLDLNGGKGSTDLLRDTRPIPHSQSWLYYTLREQCTWSKETSEQGHFKLDGTLKFHAIPRMKYAVPTSGYAFDESLAGYAGSVTTSFGYSHAFSPRVSLSGTVDVLGHYGQISARDHLQPRGEDEVRGGGLSLSTSPTFSYQTPKATLSLGLPTTLLLEHYRYGIEGARSPYSLVRLTPGASLDASYSFFPGLKLTGSGGYRGQLSRSLATFLLEPLKTRYDTRIYQRVPQLLAHRELRGMLSLVYRRPMQGLFCNLSVGWTRSYSEYSLVRDVQHGEQISSVTRRPSERDTWMGSLWFSRYFPALNTTFSLVSSLNFVSQPVLRQGRTYDSFGGGYQLQPRISFAPSSVVTLDIDGSYYMNHLSSRFFRSHAETWGLSPKLTLQPLKYTFLVLSSESTWLRTEGQRPDDLHFLDVSLRYKRRLWTLSLSAENLLDARERKSVHYNLLDEFVRRTFLRPRSILLTFNYRY